VTHSLYVKLSKNSKDYGEPDITYQLAGSAEQRPLGIPMGGACSARTSTAFKPPRFQESAMKLEDSISDFRKILMFATKTTSDFRNPDRKRARRGRIAGICTFTAPVAARFPEIRPLSCRII
jgi:hypothetical protein